ncbi:hypothetical protein A5711_21635 [Mycobacterium sp. E2238]|nr:hypothetical protein A5711_21635 [Mycobacterium sp. E2238]
MPTDIYAEAFFTADHAAVENGKVYLNGGFWNRLAFPSYPAVHSFSICAVIHIPWRAHHQTHTVAITFEDADGQTTPNRFEGEFRTGTSPDMRTGDFTDIQIAPQVTNFLFQRAGDYAAVLSVDGTEIKRWRFRAVQVIGLPTPPPGNPPAEPGNPRAEDT